MYSLLIWVCNAPFAFLAPEGGVCTIFFLPLFGFLFWRGGNFVLVWWKVPNNRTPQREKEKERKKEGK